MPSEAPAGRLAHMPTDVVESVDIDGLRTGWRSALSAAETALHATDGYLTPEQWHAERRRLTEELASTTRLLQALARDEGFPSELALPFLAHGIARRLLRLPPAVTSCVFNLDGVLVGSAALHVEAWTRTFDELISRRAEELPGGLVVPHFDSHVDYPAHVHGRPRLEGVRTFLASRGIRLPEGSPSDAPGTETVHGLANRKSQVLGRLIDERGVRAFEGSRHYLEVAHDAGVSCAVVSASAHTDAILQRTGLAGLVDERVDAETIVAEHLRGRPAPDRLLAACRKLGVEPAHAAVFETSTAGVAAGRTAGFRLVVAVDRTEDAAHIYALRAEGADVVVPALGSLLERPRLAA
jgi:beta-phosphoglucomutase-like phosphatase (HAD superfamily)